MATNSPTNIPTAASGKVLQGQGVGTNSAFSTATYPAIATTTGQLLRADGTNWVGTTATYPNTAGSNGNVLTSDGTNWSSSAATAPAGNNNNATLSAFFAYRSTNVANVTGDTGATVFTVIFNVSTFDQATNYSTSTGIFTAPKAGNYMFAFGVLTTALLNPAAVYNLQYKLVTTGRTIVWYYSNPEAITVINGTNNYGASGAAFVQMALNDTAKIQIVGNGSSGTKELSLVGAAAPGTYFSGYFVC